MLEAGTQISLLSQDQYNVGKLGNDFTQAVFATIIRNVPAVRSVGDGYVRTTFTSVNSTAQVVKSGPGNLFKVRVVNLSTGAIVVDILDGTVLRQRLFCPVRSSATVPLCAEGIWATDTKGAGTEYATSIQLKAFLSTDGTTTAAAGVTVTVDYN